MLRSRTLPPPGRAPARVRRCGLVPAPAARPRHRHRHRAPPAPAPRTSQQHDCPRAVRCASLRRSAWTRPSRAPVTRVRASASAAPSPGPVPSRPFQPCGVCPCPVSCFSATISSASCPPAATMSASLAPESSGRARVTSHIVCPVPPSTPLSAAVCGQAASSLAPPVLTLLFRTPGLQERHHRRRLQGYAQ